MAVATGSVEHVFESEIVSMEARGGAPGTLVRLEEVRAALGALREPLRRADSWSPLERRRALRLLDAVVAEVTVQRAGVVLAEQPGVGDRDSVAARARTARIGLGEARREARQARTLTDLPGMADAVASGRVPLPHVDALARVAEASGQRAVEALRRPELARQLVGMAERLTASEFAASAARLLAAADPETVERGVDAQRRARFFVLSHQPDGTYLRGRVDRLAGETLRVALAAVREAPDEHRDAAQANADALVALAERALSGMAGVRQRSVDRAGPPADDPEQDAADARVSGVAQRPQVALLVPAETFVEVRAAQERRRADPAVEAVGVAERAVAGAGAVGVEVAAAPAVGVEPAVLESGPPVAMSQLARLLCDAELSRVVLSAPSRPLDVGRSHRAFTAAQRRAVIVRDRACAWNGCEVPAAFCEVHHIRWWDRDRGRSDLENAVLLCSHHHHTVHRSDLAIERIDGPPGGRAMWAEPVRYRFTWGSGPRRGETANAPPRAGSSAEVGTPLGSVA